MKFAVVFGLIAIVNCAPTIHQFNTWKQTHNKVYEPEEELKRMSIFMDNVKFIEEFNARENRTMTLGLNHFADMTNEEFRATMLGRVNTTAGMKAWLEKEGSSYIPPDNYEAPSSVDWRTKGLVTPVKNQGQCGSCYSFSTTGSLEGQWFRKTKSLVSLSEQQIVDCSTGYGNQGCDGGLMTNSFYYLKYNGGIDTEQAYPYEGQQSYCRFRSNYVGAKVKGYTNVRANEVYLKSAVASVGPVSVAIDASSSAFQFYTGGVYKDTMCSTLSLNHAVLVVGYGTDRGSDYWIVKNSWSAGWGEGGYVRMARNYGNMCGIANMASYPLV